MLIFVVVVVVLVRCIITSLTNFTALQQPQLIFEILNTFEYQKLDWHLRAGLPI